MSEVWIVDANCIISRFFHALKKEGKKTALEAFVEFLNKLITPEKKLIIIFDKAVKNFRKKIFSKYKKDRVPNFELYEQIEQIIEYCKYHEIFAAYSKEFEADDLIAAYSRIYKKETIYIVSNDKDLMQLVDENIFFFNPFDKKIFNSNDVFNKMGVLPKEIPLLLALAGDPSDGIPGLDGIGPRKALKIINDKKLDTLKLSEIKKLELMLKLTNLRFDILG